MVALLVTMLPALGMIQARGQNRAGEPLPSAVSGKEMFTEYCASCHGLSGRGDGPVAKSLKDKPANLTTLAARNGGKFPEMRVTGAIAAGPDVPAHGTETMPVWGPIFRGNSGAEREVQLKIYNLMEYIKTLQVKK